MRRTVGFLLICLLIMVISLFLGCSDKTTQPGNKAPEITVTATPDTVDPTGVSNVVCVASDPEGGDLTYEWNPQAGDITAGVDEVAWTLPGISGTYWIEAAVTDNKGAASTDTAYVTVRGGTLLLQSESGIIAVDMEGNSWVFSDQTGEVEVLGTRIFTGRSNLAELDHNGNIIGSFTAPPEIPWVTTTIVLPDAGFAYIQNANDSIYFADPSENFLHAMPTPHQSPTPLQGTRGITVGSLLVMVDTQSDYIFTIDLATYAVDTLTAVVPGGDDLRDVFCSDGAYYTCRSYGVYSYKEGEGVSEICLIPGANHTAICVVGTYAYVCGVHREDLYRIDISTGAYDVLTSGLNNPRDMEYIPVALTPPGGW